MFADYGEGQICAVGGERIGPNLIAYEVELGATVMDFHMASHAAWFLTGSTRVAGTHPYRAADLGDFRGRVSHVW